MDILASGGRRRGAAPSFRSYLDARQAGFGDPWDVVLDPDLTSSEKREILSDWASDAHVVDGRPGLRMNAAGAVAAWDDIMEGLRLVDAEIAASRTPRPPRFAVSRAARRGAS